MKLFPHHAGLLLLAGAFALLGGCATHITTEVRQNPAPAEKFSAFSHFELADLVLVPPYAGQEPNVRALAKIQENVSLKMKPLLATWNKAGEGAASVRTLVITPVVTEIKFINGGARFWAGAMAGSSAVLVNVRITEKETGRTIATPLFYARGAAMAGAWSFGATDNLMLDRVAGRVTDYVAANYVAAVGGPTGQDPEKK